jgi:iron transport multicopper oxidase
MAILRYDNLDVPDKEPTTTFDIKNPMSETELYPRENPGAPGGEQGEVYNVHLIMNYDPKIKKYTINGFPFVPPALPVLLQILNGADPHKLLPRGSVIPLPRNKVIQVTIPGGSEDFPVCNSSLFQNTLTNLLS